MSQSTPVLGDTVLRRSGGLTKQPKANIRSKSPGRRGDDDIVDFDTLVDEEGETGDSRNKNLRKFEEILRETTKEAPSVTALRISADAVKEREINHNENIPLTARQTRVTLRSTSNNQIDSRPKKRKNASAQFQKMLFVSNSSPFDEQSTSTSGGSDSQLVKKRRSFRIPFFSSQNFDKKEVPASPSLGSELWGAHFVNDDSQLCQPVEYVAKFESRVVKAAFGWQIESPSTEPSHAFANNYIEFNQCMESVYYITEFFAKEHRNFFAIDSRTRGKVIVSARRDKEAKLVRVIIRTKKDTTKLEIPLSAVKRLHLKAIVKDIAANEGRQPNLTLTNLHEIDAASLPDALVTYEKADIFKRYKFGVLLVKEGQTKDDQFFCNCDGSERYEQFLKVLGKKIKLKGWKKYGGGLDTVGHSTGKNSIFKTFYSLQKKYQIMYHVSTMLPFDEDDTQHVERKRHLGNDVVNIIFNDSSSPFDPASIVTNFIHVYIVVQMDEEASRMYNDTYYRVEVVSQQQVPNFNPPLRDPPIFSADELAAWLPAKCINAERASFQAPAIRFKLISTRKQLLDDLFSQYMPN